MLYQNFYGREDADEDNERSLHAVLDVIWPHPHAPLDNMPPRGTRGAYRKEDRVQLPKELQKEVVEKAAARYGNCQELARHLDIPKFSVHYYRIGRLTMPVSVLERIIEIARDEELEERIRNRGITKDRTWANEYSSSIMREMYREKVRLPTREDLERDDGLRRKAAAIVSYVMAEGSVWLQKERLGECAVNITFAEHESDLYEHFRSLCKDVFDYDIGQPQPPGNGAKAIRGFIYSRFVAEWMIENGILPGDKASRCIRLPKWIMDSGDVLTWTAALQPWCDGEGHVCRRSDAKVTGFVIAQGRHTDLDIVTLSHNITWRGKARHLNMNQFRTTEAFGISVRDYCLMTCRSEILEDVKVLFERLGFAPRMRIHSMYLKDDGFWSCNWTLGFCSTEVGRLVRLGLIMQKRKVLRAAGAGNLMCL